MTCMRDEGPWCLDWIAHHLAAGFDHMLICSHDVADAQDEMLDLLEQAGLVTHLRFTPRGKKSIQWQALKLLGDHTRYQTADWALFLDCDEYLNLAPPLNTVQDLIARLPGGSDAVPLRWRLFGNAGHSEMQDLPVTERFTRAALVDIHLPLAHFFKTLFRPAAFRAPGVHRPKRRKGHEPLWSTAAGQLLNPAFTDAEQRITLTGLPARGELACLNHYSVRSIDEFILKSLRGLPNHMDKAIDPGYWAERNFNTVQELSIARMKPATDAKRALLRAVPGLEELHQAALQHHRQNLRAALQDPRMVRLYWQLELMGDSAPPDAEKLQRHLQRLSGVKQG
jgi:glycosyl transferase family 2